MVRDIQFLVGETASASKSHPAPLCTSCLSADQYLIINPLTVIQRQAFIGFAASVVSDTISNSLRVVKTYRQVHEKNVGYCTSSRLFEISSRWVCTDTGCRDGGERDCSCRGHSRSVWSWPTHSPIDQRSARSAV